MKSFLKFATRPDNLVLVICLCLFAAVVAHGENGPTPQVIVGSSGISDGSVTNAKLSEPVAIEKGGTGKTTAAAGLAALGGASLNGSSTVDFLARNMTISEKLQTSSTTINLSGATGHYSFLLKTREVEPDGTIILFASGTLALTPAVFGKLMISDIAYYRPAEFMIGATDGVSNALTEQADPRNIYTTTPDNASTLNVYWDNRSILFQNKTTQTVAVQAFLEVTK